MALPVNSIGAYNVRNWIGDPPPLVQYTIEVLSYPGVSMEALRRHELRSGVFQLTAAADASTITAARTRLADYAALVGGVAQQLVWNDDDYDDRGLRVMVVRVTPLYVRRRVLICGAQTAGNTVDFSARFDLIFTAYP